MKSTSPRTQLYRDFEPGSLANCTREAKSGSAEAGSYTQGLRTCLVAGGSWKGSFRTVAPHFSSLEGLETPAKTGRVLIGASLGNSSCLISFSVRKAKQVQQKGKVTCTAMKSLTVTGNGSQVIILTGGAHCLSEVVRNLKFVMSCSFILCLSFLCSL